MPKLKMLLFGASILTSIFIIDACSSKKLSHNYGDDKNYQDEDSVGEAKIKEKKTKMPFDTTALPIVPKR